VQRPGYITAGTTSWSGSTYYSKLCALCLKGHEVEAVQFLRMSLRTVESRVSPASIGLPLLIFEYINLQFTERDLLLELDYYLNGRYS
jgi:hypothetical protein